MTASTVIPRIGKLHKEGARRLNLAEARPCVYFLTLAGEVVYVGQATNGWSRISVHVKDDAKVFDAAHAIFLEPDQLDLVESAYIHRLRPKHNHKMPNGQMIAPMSARAVSDAAALRGFTWPDVKSAQRNASAAHGSTNPAARCNPHQDSGGHTPQGSPSDALIRLPEVEALIGLKRTAIYLLIREGKFPAPVKLGPRAARWPKRQILKWIEERLS